MSYLSYIRLIVYNCPSHFSISPSKITYHHLPIPMIPLSLSSPPPLLLLNAPMVSLGYTERYDPTIAFVVSVPASDQPLDTIL